MNVSFGNTHVLTCRSPRKMQAQNKALVKAQEMGGLVCKREILPKTNNGTKTLWEDVVIFSNNRAKDREFMEYCFEQGLEHTEIERSKIMTEDAILDRMVMPDISLREGYGCVMVDVEKMLDYINTYACGEGNVENGMEILESGRNIQVPHVHVNFPGNYFVDEEGHDILCALKSAGIKKTLVCPTSRVFNTHNCLEKDGILTE